MASTKGIKAGRAYVELGVHDRLSAGLAAASAKLKAWGAGIATMGAKTAAFGAAVVAPMLGAAKHFASAGSALWDMSKRTGVSVEALSTLGYAAQQSGSDMESLEKGLRKMQKTIVDAAGGSSSAVDALSKLGLSVATLKGLAPEDQFALIADRLDKIVDPTLKTAMAMDLFGRSGTALLPMIDGGAAGLKKFADEAKRLGIIVSTKDAAAADALGDDMDALWKQIKMVAFQIGAALAPELLQLAQYLKDGLRQVIDWIKANPGWATTILKVAAAVVILGGGLMLLGGIFKGLAFALILVKGAFAAVCMVGSALLAVLKLIITPVGLVITAITAMVGAVLWARGDVSKATTWMGDRFLDMKDAAVTAWGGIVDALKAGDLALAGKIALAGLKVVWVAGLSAITGAWGELWTGLKVFALEGWHGLKMLANDALSAITQLFIDAGFAWEKVLAHVVSLFKDVWTSMKASGKIAAVIANPFELDKETAIKQVLEEAKPEVEASAKERDAKLKHLEDASRFARQLNQQEHDERERQILDEGKARIDAVKAANEADKQAALDALAAAKGELNALVTEAREKAAAVNNREAPVPPGGKPKPGPDDEEAWGRAVSARGIFNIAATQSLVTSSSPMTKIATATAATAKSTASLDKKIQGPFGSYFK